MLLKLHFPADFYYLMLTETARFFFFFNVSGSLFISSILFGGFDFATLLKTWHYFSPYLVLSCKRLHIILPVQKFKSVSNMLPILSILEPAENSESLVSVCLFKYLIKIGIKQIDL